MNELGIVFFLLVAVAFFAIRIVMGSNALEKWASENRYRLIDSERRIFRLGPFFFSGRGQKIYRVTVELPDGQIRSAWVRTGGMFLGSLSANVDVKWDNDPAYHPGFPVVLPDEPADPKDRNANE